MSNTSYVELCVSDFEQSIAWFEHVLGFRVTAYEANEYAELAHGETRIQLATDTAPYWESERAHLLPSGQRGSGVEIVLLVENVDTVYQQAQQAQADIVRPLAEVPWHMRQFWVRHPDGYLIRPAQRLLSVNPAQYRRQVAKAFEEADDEDNDRIIKALMAVKRKADTLARQGDVLGAATIYETLVMEIFEQSHLYIDEDAEYDNFSEEEGYYPEEESLDEFVEECIEALGQILAKEQTDRVARQKTIDVLFAIYRRDTDVYSSVGFADSAEDQLTQHTTPLEQETLAARIRATLADKDEQLTSSARRAYGGFLLELEEETLDDEAYLRICRESGRTADLIDRLLTLGRIDEAVEEMKRFDTNILLSLVPFFIAHGQDTVAERLVKARLAEKPDMALLRWLQQYYHERGNRAAELEVVETLFREQPYLRRYQELRALAEQVGRWETLRQELLAFLEERHNTNLLIEIALDEGDIDLALQRLEGMKKKDIYGYLYGDAYGFDRVSLQVAGAAEETRPQAAIKLYRQRAERLIAQRGRPNYQLATTHLAQMRALYEKLGEGEAWTNYVTTLRERNRNLRALQEELTNAGL